MTPTRLGCLVLAALMPLAAACAPDEEALGKPDGYPFQRLSPDFSLFTDRYKVGNFTHLEQIFWAREIAASAQPRPLQRALRMASGVKWSDQGIAGQVTDMGLLSADTYYRRGAGGATAFNGIRQVVAPPDTRFNYSSAETLALGIALRGAVGMDLAKYASRKLWQPMGAETAASWLTDASRQPEYLRPCRATQFAGYGYQTWIYPFRTRTFEARGLFGQRIVVQPSSKVVIVIVSAFEAGDPPSAVTVERNDFVGSVLKALGGQADVYSR